MRAMQLGSYDLMIRSMVRFYSGYIQIHSDGYWDEQTLDNSFEFDEEFIKNVEKTNGVELVVPRLESFALGSSGELTKGVMVVGTDPELENKFMQLSDKLTEGSIFKSEDKSILIAEGLAGYFGIGVNDTLVLLSQGYHGVSAAGKYQISGIVKFGTPQLNDRILFLPLNEAQWFYGAENRITSLALLVEDRNKIEEIIAQLKGTINTDIYIEEGDNGGSPSPSGRAGEGQPPLPLRQQVEGTDDHYIPILSFQLLQNPNHTQNL